MDAAAFRWVLVIIAVVLGIAIYLFGQHQSRMRKRSAMDTYTREEIDSAFVEDEQLRFELDNLNQILQADETGDSVDQIQINPAQEVQKTPFSLPDPEVFSPPELAGKDEDQYISYMLRHEDFRLITGEEAAAAVAQAGLELNDQGYLEWREDDETCFVISSLSPPGHFHELDQLKFTTLGFNCFIELDYCQNPRGAYEVMLKKIDELVRMLNVKVYKSTQELLTISDVTELRQSLH